MVVPSETPQERTRKLLHVLVHDTEEFLPLLLRLPRNVVGRDVLRNSRVLLPPLRGGNMDETHNIDFSGANVVRPDVLGVVRPVEEADDGNDYSSLLLHECDELVRRGEVVAHVFYDDYVVTLPHSVSIKNEMRLLPGCRRRDGCDLLFREDDTAADGLPESAREQDATHGSTQSHIHFDLPVGEFNSEQMTKVRQDIGILLRGGEVEVHLSDVGLLAPVRCVVLPGIAHEGTKPLARLVLGAAIVAAAAPQGLERVTRDLNR